MLYDAEAPVAEAVVLRTVLWGTQWGQLDDLLEPVVVYRSRKLVVEVRFSVLRHGELLCPYSIRGFRRGADSFSACKTVTWLILPVVICLSQRLSHACLSISKIYCETANGSLNQS